jgi:hypothetical protein
MGNVKIFGSEEMTKLIDRCWAIILGAVMALVIINLWHFNALSKAKERYYKARTSQIVLDVCQKHKEACND